MADVSMSWKNPSSFSLPREFPNFLRRGRTPPINARPSSNSNEPLLLLGRLTS
jgi:hypothetical protein